MASFTFVYVLREVGFDPASSRGKLPRTYVGWSTDVAARLATHNSGKGRKPREADNGTLSMLNGSGPLVRR